MIECTFQIKTNNFRYVIVANVERSKYKISRRLVPGKSLWGRAKDPSIKKNYPPGQHGALVQRKSTDYGVQLRAKQKLKGYYAIKREKQFRRIFAEAVRMKGDTSENLVGMLERRIDMVIYRMNAVPTIFAAAQLVSHGHVKVDGRTVSRNFYVKPGQEIELSIKAKEMPVVLQAVQTMEREMPAYLEFDGKAMKGKLLKVPSFAEIPYPVAMEPNLVVEFYSR